MTRPIGCRAGWLAAALAVATQLPAPAIAAPQLPPETVAALRRAGVPGTAISVVVHDLTTDRARDRLRRWLTECTALAGHVLSHIGRRCLLVAIVNHDEAAAVRRTLDALVPCTPRDAPAF